ncbi:hypothetical protein MRB53_007385 [Persea americana]|uniref:Uncharacterized protein n=1 Tax=Persea americana TaxID=3435 RepID=A0ACC2MIU6_PERAE|nr:hypothetical protein MRB53_007385 [Persea americana]
MSGLQYLDVSNNGFSGKLPPDIDTIFPDFVAFNMSTNELQGAIPLSLSKLQKLKTLDLSQNKLFGEMPEESFQSLENIESLDLSHNKLVGIIPPQITQLHSLSTFSVAFNDLSGVIPHEKQFLTFNESSYTGNHDLCGPPLPLNCSSNNPSQTRANKEEEEDNSEILDSPMFFYLLVAISYALGFWSFIALICNKNRRESLFRTVDRCCDWVYKLRSWHARELLRRSAILLREAAPTFQSSSLLAEARPSAESKDPPSSKKGRKQARRQIDLCCLHGICRCYVDSMPSLTISIEIDGYGFRNGSEMQASYEDLAFSGFFPFSDSFDLKSMDRFLDWIK